MLHKLFSLEPFNACVLSFSRKGVKALTSARPTAFIVLLLGPRLFCVLVDAGRSHQIWILVMPLTPCVMSNLSFQSPTNQLGIKKKLLQLSEVMNAKSSAQCLRQGKPIASSYYLKEHGFFLV